MGATARSEVFGRGKTPLWNIAMKHFPPTQHEAIGTSNGDSPCQGSAPGDVMPSTAGADTACIERIPDTQDPYPRPDILFRSDPLDRRIVALLQSAPGSAVNDMSVAITESMVSWGRALDNTRSYSPKTEAKVPKYAFKILLWKQDYDPYKNFRPWNRTPELDEASFYFYIATKATNGIFVNGRHLPSVNCRNAASPCTYWIRLHDGDSVVVWQTSDGSSKSELIFRCDWGGSAQPRPQGTQPSFADDPIARRLDELCVKTERKMRGLSEHDLKMEEANHDYDQRLLRINAERDRSRLFELRRLEACRAMAAAKRGSPISLGAGAHNDSVPSTRLSHMAGNRTVPTFRTTSPSAADLLRGARR